MVYGGRTQFPRAFADAIQCVHNKGFRKTNMPSIERSLYATPALSVLFLSIIERSVLMALVFYYKDMLEEVTIQRSQQLSPFVCYRTQLNATHSHLFETDCFCRNVPISNDSVVRISRDWQKNSLVNDLSRKV